MKILFKGTRGTMPVPGKTTLKYGGNTSSLFVQADAINLYFDAGSGLSVERSNVEEEILSGNVYHLFLSHLHYDHMIGFPFFRPFFDPHSTVHIYGPKPDQMESLEYALNQFLRAPFMPFSISSYKAGLQIHQLEADTAVRLSDNTGVETFELSHPNGCLAYKVTERHSCESSDGHSVSKFVYATDTTDFVGQRRRDFVNFIRSADLLVIDAFFDDDEMTGTFDGIDKRSWGHCSWEQAVELAKEGEVRNLALFHHLHSRSDAQLDEIEKEAKARFEGAFCAYEGCLVEL